ncbi:MAG: Holliday junction branch migration protein RuvA [Clostridia bacterium]|nr:Holliday junction branch migration protein RuvA [Clostridia bacterium]MBQ3816206.1 Holliday junction branch migration protein RuvA [Clostridia bacterium]MBR4185235.1 Holliday junction branch migration protein RuvA [Clostridia bacterium]
MIETLYGKIFEINAASCAVVIECAGVGYRVTVTAPTIAKLPSPKFAPDGSTLDSPPVRIYTHMAVREDAVELYGFADREELDMYKLLISVSGVGPKAGLSILSLLTPRKLAAAVASGDSKGIARAPGVGPKTASRVVLELKDKIPKKFPHFTDRYDTGDAEPSPAANPTAALADAKEVLLTLGYSRSEITAAMKHVDPSAEADVIIKNALAALMKG